MRRIVACLLVLTCTALPAAAWDVPRQIGQVALLPLPNGPHDHIDQFVRTHWQPFYNTGHEHAFTAADLKAGRFDLDGDGNAELVLMIDQPGWEAQQGMPLVVATWTKKGWNAVGWSWGDEDTVFATTEVLGGWRTLDTGPQLLRWTGKEYQRIEKVVE